MSEQKKFYILDNCLSCGICYDVCPTGSVDVSKRPTSINLQTCTGCGACRDSCPIDAVAEVK